MIIPEIDLEKDSKYPRLYPPPLDPALPIGKLHHIFHVYYSEE